MNDEDEFMEKRSILRSWRERKGKPQRRSRIIVVTIAALVFLALVFGYINFESKSAQQANKTLNSTPTPAKTPFIPAPSIKIDSPANTTYNTNMVPVSVAVAGSDLDKVLLRLDNGKNVTIPHDRYLAKLNSERNLSDGMHTLTVYASSKAGKSSSLSVYFEINTTPARTKTVFGKMGAPVVSSGLEVTVESVTPTSIYTSVWLSVKNTEREEKPFKIGSGTVVIDNKGQQYENIKVARSAEIAQTSLYPRAMREGAVFFERLKEGRKPDRLVLYVNGNRLEFELKK